MSLSINHLTKKYGSQLALDDISFEAEKGQVLGFLGPNGAGKSTTMKIATGFISADSGDVLVNGISVREKFAETSKLIGYLPEHNPLYLDMYVREFLEFIGGLYGMHGRPLKERVSALVGLCGLEVEAHKKIEALSKGYRQRVGLAKALIHDPEVIILDEPTTGLDPNQLVEIRKLIKTISQNKTLILSTHIMQEVEAICDKVVIINKGKIVASDLLSNLKSGNSQAALQLETEEELELDWFAGLGKAEYLANRSQVAISVADVASGRKGLLSIIQEKNLTLVSIQLKENNLKQFSNKSPNSKYMLALYRKEINAFFSNLSGYLILAVFLVSLGLIVWVFPDTSVLEYGFADLEPLFVYTPFVFIFLIPAITMKMIAEERRSGTWEILMTSPLGILRVVLGKYLASLTLIVLALVPTLLFYYSIVQLGDPVGNIDHAGFFGSWMGLCLMGAVFASIGIFASALTSHQIVAFIWGVFLSFLLYFGLTALVQMQIMSPFALFLESLSLSYHFESMGRGVIGSENLAYFLAIVVLMLGLTTIMLKRR